MAARHIKDPEELGCQEMVVFAPIGSAILDPDQEWVDNS